MPTRYDSTLKSLTSIDPNNDEEADSVDVSVTTPNRTIVQTTPKSKNSVQMMSFMDTLDQIQSTKKKKPHSSSPLIRSSVKARKLDLGRKKIAERMYHRLNVEDEMTPEEIVKMRKKSLAKARIVETRQAKKRALEKLNRWKPI